MKYETWLARYLARVERLRDDAVEEGDAAAAAMAGALVQAVVHHRRASDDRQSSWPTNADVATILGVTPGQVSRLAEKRLRTNGRTHKGCRINPESLADYQLSRPKRTEKPPIAQHLRDVADLGIRCD